MSILSRRRRIGCLRVRRGCSGVFSRLLLLKVVVLEVIRSCDVRNYLPRDLKDAQRTGDR